MRNLMTMIGVFVAGALALGLGGCGTKVEVPPGHVGKVLGPSGLQKDLHQPGSFRLPWVGPAGSNYTLVLAEVSDNNKSEKLEVFMPKDNLTLTFEVRGTFRIPNDETHAQEIFARMKPTKSQAEDTSEVTFDSVYDTYGHPVVPQVAMRVAAGHTIEELLVNRDKIGAELQEAVRKELKETPLTVVNFGFGNITPPGVIVKAQELAKERQIQIEQAKASQLVKMTEAETQLQVAKKHQEIDLTEAETQMLVNKKLAEGITPAWIAQRALKVMQDMAESPNKVFIIPTEAFQNPAMMMGITNSMMNDLHRPLDPSQPHPEKPADSSNPQAPAKQAGAGK